MESNKSQWTEVISPQNKWFDLRLQELWRYRDLIILFVRRDFVAIYKQTILGPLWHIIQPLMTTLVYTIIFSRVAGIPTDGQPAILFYLCNITIWNYFASSLSKTSNTFTGNADIFGKVYFPRLVIPLSIVISALIAFVIQFGVFLFIYLIYWMNGMALSFTWAVLLIPYFIFIMASLALGLGIIISSLTTKYRDLTQLLNFGIQLLMFASGIIYPLSDIPEVWQGYLLLNPIVPIVEAFRYAFFGEGFFDAYYLLYSTIFVFITFFLGLLLFRRVEKTFMDTV